MDEEVDLIFSEYNLNDMFSESVCGVGGIWPSHCIASFGLINAPSISPPSISQWTLFNGADCREHQGSGPGAPGQENPGLKKETSTRPYAG